MTVGISLTHGKRLEAIVITDSRASSSVRHSDSVNKIGCFESDNYNGVIFGSGNANHVEGIIKTLDYIAAPDLNDFVKKIQLNHAERVNSLDKSVLDVQKSEIAKKASLLLPDMKYFNFDKDLAHIPESERQNFMAQFARMIQQKYDQFVENEIKSVMQRYDNHKQQNGSTFILVAYDKKSNVIRQWQIDEVTTNELFSDHIEIGSGSDGANMYLATSLQGINPASQLNTDDLLLFTLNAYNSSTMNHGVGGRPKIYRVSKDGNYLFPDEETNVLVNLSGAYLSKFDEENLTTKLTKELISHVISEHKNYGNISKCLGLNVDTLKTLTIPYSSWQNRVNQNSFD